MKFENINCLLIKIIKKDTKILIFFKKNYVIVIVPCIKG